MSSPAMTPLHKLFILELKDIFSAEKQLVKALPKMAKAAANPDLQKAFREHLEQTKIQVERIEQVFEILGMSPKSKTCKAMQGLIEEGQELTGEKLEPSVMDAGLIAAAQKVEHYEISGYGTLRTWARLLNEKKIAALFEETLKEEKAADEKLGALAETTVNTDAAGE